MTTHKMDADALFALSMAVLPAIADLDSFLMEHFYYVYRACTHIHDRKRILAKLLESHTVEEVISEMKKYLPETTPREMAKLGL